MQGVWISGEFFSCGQQLDPDQQCTFSKGIEVTTLKKF